MAADRLEVIRHGVVVADGVDSLEDVEGYIEGCNPLDEVRWSDSLGGMQGGTELQKISIPDAMAVREFAEKIEVRPAEIIKWLFLRGEVAGCNSEIGFGGMKEFAAGYGFICERETEERDIGDHIIKDIVFHIDPIEFYDNMIDFPVMGMEEIPDCFKDEVNQAVSQAISELITANSITETGSLILDLDIRVQAVLANEETVYKFVVIVLDSKNEYEHTSKNVIVKGHACLSEFKKYYTKKLEVLFFGDVKTIGGIR